MLKAAKDENPNLITKSSIMLGLGESDEEVLQTLKGISYIINKFSVKLINYLSITRFKRSWRRMRYTWTIYATDKTPFESGRICYSRKIQTLGR